MNQNTGICSHCGRRVPCKGDGTAVLHYKATGYFKNKKRRECGGSGKLTHQHKG